MKLRATLFALTAVLFSVSPAFAQTSNQNGEVITGDTGSSSQGNETETEQELEQEMEGDDNSKSGDVNVDQSGGGGAPTATGGTLANIAIGAGPILSPPIVLNGTEALNNSNSTKSQTSSQSSTSTSSNSTTSTESTNVVSRSFNDNRDSLNGAGFGFGSGTTSGSHDTFTTNTTNPNTIRLGSVDSKLVNSKSLANTGIDTFPILAVGMLIFASGLLLYRAGWPKIAPWRQPVSRVAILARTILAPARRRYFGQIERKSRLAIG